MTLIELIAQLQDLAATHGDREVRLAQQPSYPFEYSIGRIAAVNVHQDDIDHCIEALRSGTLTPEEVTEAQEQVDEYENPDNTVVYIGEGRQLDYLPGAVSQQLGWR